MLKEVALFVAAVMASEVLHTDGQPHPEVDVSGRVKNDTVASWRMSTDALTPGRADEFKVSLKAVLESATGTKFMLV